MPPSPAAPPAAAAAPLDLAVRDRVAEIAARADLLRRAVAGLPGMDGADLARLLAQAEAVAASAAALAALVDPPDRARG